jgi:hypothetical protein
MINHKFGIFRNQCHGVVRNISVLPTGGIKLGMSFVYRILKYGTTDII